MTDQRTRSRGRHPSEGLNHNCADTSVPAGRGGDLTTWMCTRCPTTWTRRTWKPRKAHA